MEKIKSKIKISVKKLKERRNMLLCQFEHRSKNDSNEESHNSYDKKVSKRRTKGKYKDEDIGLDILNEDSIIFGNEKVKTETKKKKKKKKKKQIVKNQIREEEFINRKLAAIKWEQVKKEHYERTKKQKEIKLLIEEKQAIDFEKDKKAMKIEKCKQGIEFMILQKERKKYELKEFMKLENEALMKAREIEAKRLERRKRRMESVRKFALEQKKTEKHKLDGVQIQQEYSPCDEEHDPLLYTDNYLDKFLGYSI